MTYVTNADRFMSALGMDKAHWNALPAMFPQLNVQVTEDAEAFHTRLRTVSIAGAPLEFRTAADGFVSMDFGHDNLGEFRATVGGREFAPADLGLSNASRSEDSRRGVTAYHIPEGLDAEATARAAGPPPG